MNPSLTIVGYHFLNEISIVSKYSSLFLAKYKIQLIVQRSLPLFAFYMQVRRQQFSNKLRCKCVKQGLQFLIVFKVIKAQISKFNILQIYILFQNSQPIHARYYFRVPFVPPSFHKKYRVGIYIYHIYFIYVCILKLLTLIIVSIRWQQQSSGTGYFIGILRSYLQIYVCIMIFLLYLINSFFKTHLKLDSNQHMQKREIFIGMYFKSIRRRIFFNIVDELKKIIDKFICAYISYICMRNLYDRQRLQQRQVLNIVKSRQLELYRYEKSWNEIREQTFNFCFQKIVQINKM
eukprot:TRINITY_DN11538_c0_g1_i4.p2 TRINITY_DN11538_c0_g1~~TRINITY_DN11538_c0_g1_i4.p2  ORF type:complete len:291 (+),score=-19.64 TRINITY_DN11538_c0_g1_i4:286-1158(+)